MNISGKHILIVSVISLSSLWGYGYSLALNDLDEGLSLIEADFTHKSLNPLSAIGYKQKLNNSTRWQNHVNNIQCEKRQREIVGPLYTRKKFGNDWYKYKKEAIAKSISDNCSQYK